MDDVRSFSRRDDLRVVTLCSNILQLDIRYRTKASSEILEPVFPLTKKEEISSTRAHMKNGSTADLASANAAYDQQSKKIARKKKLRRRKKLSTTA